ncbi:MAG: multidrug efflux SMR transporter [Candidatus Omnitrophica bacterium]|nr:multidrug efflux SMR transporter [Candidatus Omnitrophota bacterium]
MHWFYLVTAILGEVVATSSLKLAEGFTKLIPSMIAVAGYSVAFYFLSLALKHIPLGVAYAIWCGIGIVIITLVGWFIYKQPLDIPAIIGITLIFVGVLSIYLFSKSVIH